MCEHEATVLVALPPTDRRADLVSLLRDRGFGVVTADDGIEAVDAVRDADAVLVGGYPDRITAAVVDATTPPGVARPNVLVGDVPDVSDRSDEPNGDRVDTATGPDGDRVEADTRLPASATNEAVADAVARAVARRAYRERVSELSAVAAEAANSDRGTNLRSGRVTTLAEEARRLQDVFAASDWTATFRTMANANGDGGPVRFASPASQQHDTYSSTQ